MSHQQVHLQEASDMLVDVQCGQERAAFQRLQQGSDLSFIFFYEDFVGSEKSIIYILDYIIFLKSWSYCRIYNL